jgi:hypothetical protein
LSSFVLSLFQVWLSTLLSRLFEMKEWRRWWCLLSVVFSAWFFFFCLSLFSLCAHCFPWFYPPRLLFASVLKEKRITLVPGTCCLQLQTKMTVWKCCSTNTASSPPVFSSVSPPFSLLLLLSFYSQNCMRFFFLYIMKTFGTIIAVVTVER